MAENNLALETNLEPDKQSLEPATKSFSKVKALEAEIYGELNQIIQKDHETVDYQSSYKTYGLNILEAVLRQHYEHAVKELNSLRKIHETYPKFYQEAEKYIDYSKLLIEGIRDLRLYLQRPNVSRTMQKQAMNKLRENFSNLRTCVSNIEKIERKHRVGDISSTKWFVFASYFTILGFFISCMVYFALPSQLDAIYVLIEDISGFVVDRIFKIFGWM